jgi:hypothetical protein
VAQNITSLARLCIVPSGTMREKQRDRDHEHVTFSGSEVPSTLRPSIIPSLVNPLINDTTDKGSI